MSSFNKEIFEIESQSDQLKPLRDKLRILLEQAGFCEKTAESILVALGEGVTNAIRHSYLGQPGKKIIVSYEEFPDKVTLKIRDFGIKFDPKKVPEPVIPPVKGGGLGVYFMKTIMDELAYNTDHTQGNELILSKKKEGIKSWKYRQSRLIKWIGSN